MRNTFRSSRLLLTASSIALCLGLGLFIVACSDNEVLLPLGGLDSSAPIDAAPPAEDASFPGDSAVVADAQDSGTSGAIPDGAAPDAADAADAALIAKPVELTFEGRVGSEVFACGKTFSDVGTSKASATAGDFRFFVHDIKLLRGNEEVPMALDTRAPWQNPRIGLIDFEDNTGECEFGNPGTNNKLTGSALGSGFDGISFTLGVPEDLNHLNKEVQAAPLPGSGMNWDWTNGYIHLAVQLNPTTMVAGARAPSFFSHIGSTVCSGDPAMGGTPNCARKNRPRVRVTGMDPTKSKIVVDARKLYLASDLNVNTPMTISGCMSSPTDPECPAVFALLGLDITTGAAVGPATIVSLEAK
jgi:uncharacterized repeat protein (TIGR04052 family)